MTLVWHLSWNWCNTAEEFVEQIVTVCCLLLLHILHTLPLIYSYTASHILPLQTAAYTTASPTMQCLSYDASLTMPLQTVGYTAHSPLQLAAAYR